MAVIIGSAYKELMSVIVRYAKADRPVMLLGDTGSGKELFAEHYMKLSGRKGQRRTVSCAVFSGDLLYSEIFGHVRGAFTGAQTKRDGLLITCNKGILFLDELDKASKELQHAILRVAEGNSFKQLGSDEEIKGNDTLIIAAASRLSCIDDQLVNRFHILTVPTLQKFDIPALAEHFLGRPLDDELTALLMSREYPGNVRELSKFCESLSIERGWSPCSGPERKQRHEDHPFEYKRFRDEFLLWHEYLVPLIDEFHLDIRYQYQAESAECPAPFLDETIRLMKALRHGSKEMDVVDRFDHALRSHIKDLQLPSLLGAIFKKFKAPISQDIRGRMDAALPMLVMGDHKHQGDHADEFPVDERDEVPGQLRVLFKMPFGEARKSFIKLYLEHVLHMNGYSHKKAAKMMGLSIKGLESTMRRHGIKRPLR